jgi:hypothetical protein
MMSVAIEEEVGVVHTPVLEALQPAPDRVQKPSKLAN